MSECKRISFLSYIKSQRSTVLIIVLLILGVLLLLYESGSTSLPKSVNQNQRLEEYAHNLENKMASLCENVKGVSNVSVTVYFSSGFETVYACNEESKTTSSGNTSQKKYVTVGSGNDESMVSIVELMPKICGVAIVCQGGGDPVIARSLSMLLSAAYGISMNQIYVAEAKR